MNKKILYLSLLILIFIFVSCSKSLNNKTKEELSEIFITHLTKGEYKKARKQFDLIMKVSLTPSLLKKIWIDSSKVYGKFINIENIKEEKRDDKYVRIFVKCRFENGIINYKIVYTKKNQITGFFYSPEYTTAKYIIEDNFSEKEVKFGKGDWILPGTLSIPNGDGPFPIVTIVHGSGPNNRDGKFFGYQVYKDIAQGLASRNIAVLRYDKWTYVIRKNKDILKKYKNYTVQEEVINGLEEAVLYINSLNSKIDKNKIFVIGHSQGANLIPRIAREINAAGYISMAGNYSNLEDLLIYQYEYLSMVDGKKKWDEKLAIYNIKKRVKAVKSKKLNKKTPTFLLPLNTPASYWMDLLKNDVTIIAEDVDKPWLFLQGERDYQVPLEEFNKWKKLLNKKNNVTFISYKRLNHNFIPGKGKSTPDEYKIPGNVDEKVIEDLNRWIKNQK